MKELLTRSLVGILFLAIVFVPYFTDMQYHLNNFNVVLLVFSLIGTVELFRMSPQTNGKKSLLLLALVFNLIVFTPMILFTLHDLLPNLPFNDLDRYNNFNSHTLLVVGILVLALSLLFFIILIFRKQEIIGVFKQTFLLSILYPLLPLALLSFSLSLSSDTEKQLLLFVLLPIYLNDTLAYGTGRLFGKNKLFPSVSPKKTWEGFIGGVLGTLLIVNITVYFLASDFRSEAMIVCSFISVSASILATFGDLFESKLKRAAGVKDAGKILPGHGGILDRIDAMLFVAPLLYVFLQLF